MEVRIVGMPIVAPLSSHLARRIRSEGCGSECPGGEAAAFAEE
tara:strand:- start:728 stop:856 length:129 start_codon:yes stop_codon:yes gene_type:complete